MVPDDRVRLGRMFLSAADCVRGLVFIIGTPLRAQFLTGTGMVVQNDAWKRAV